MTATPPAPTDPPARPRVLVVDDEPPIVELVQGYLRREGWEVLTVADGPAAIAAVREHAPDAVSSAAGIGPTPRGSRRGSPWR